MRRIEIGVTLDGAGAGTAESNVPLWGHVEEVRCNSGTAFMGTAGGGGTVHLTRSVDGGTILSVAPGTAPWSYHPTTDADTNAGGTTAYTAGVGPVRGIGIPLDGYMTLTVEGGGSVASGTVHVYVA